MEKTLSRFKAVEKKLAAEPWFKKEGWLTSVHPFPAKNPVGITFHVFKKNWFNEDRQGIHIESHLAFDPKKQKKTYLTLHLLHEGVIPGTSIKRMAITKPFVDEIFGEVSSWNGYTFRAGKYGQQPFTRYLDGTSPSFAAELTTEVTRICRRLGPTLDKVIAGAK